MSIMVGTDRGARTGVLVKNAKALELTGKIDTLVDALSKDDIWAVIAYIQARFPRTK